MNYLYIDKFFGYSAALLTTLAFLPQVIKVARTKSASDISISTLILFMIGLICWIIYGVLTESYPVLVANIVTLILNTSILYLKLIHSKNNLL